MKLMKHTMRLLKLGRKASLTLGLGLLAVVLAGCAAFFAQAPIAIISATPTSGEAPLLVGFDGSGSFDPNTNGVLTKYQWDFGDGSALALGVTQSHSYKANGTFIATLKVTNNFGKVGVDLLPLTVGKPSIFFSSDRGGNYNIFRMDTNGGNQAQVTNYASRDALWPALLPNTRDRLAYSHEVQNPDLTTRFQLFTSQVDGTLPAQLTTQSSSNSIQPSWSPDGSKITFASDRDKASCGCWGIYLMNSDGTGTVTLRVQSGSNNFAPAIWPDGKKIAFAANSSGNYEIYTMNLDGTGVVNITNNTHNDGGPQLSDSDGLPGAPSAVPFSGPSLSPDGTQIAFTSNRDGPDLDVFIMNADGTNVIQLTSSSADDYDPFWLPGGGEVAFVSTLSGGSPQLWKINTTSHAQVQLTSTGTNLNAAGAKNP